MADILQKNKYVDPTTLNKSINIIDNIKKIDPRFDIYYKTRVRHYSLQDHTELVLKEFDKYFPRPIVIGFIDRESFRIFLALHDIGKAPAYLVGNKNDQAKYTKDLLSDIRNRIKEIDCFFSYFTALISDDPLGKYFRGKYSLQEAKTIIREICIEYNLILFEYFQLLTIYYQVDAGSYTEDAGGIRYLEHLFKYLDGNKVRHTDETRLVFSDNYERIYNNLKRALFE